MKKTFRVEFLNEKGQLQVIFVHADRMKFQEGWLLFLTFQRNGNDEEKQEVVEAFNQDFVVHVMQKTE